MSVNKFINGELVKVSKGLPNASEIYYRDDNGWLNTTNVKDSIKILDEKKINIDNILTSLDEVNASTNKQDVTNVSPIKAINSTLSQTKNTFTNKLYRIFYIKEWRTPTFNLENKGITSLTMDIGLSGYTPIGIVSRYAYRYYFFPYNEHIHRSNNTIDLAFKSTTSSYLPSCYFSFHILYVKNGYSFVNFL